MKTKIIGLLASIFILWTDLPLSAQNLSLLPCDPAIRSCVLPDGLSCYVAANPSEKGFADVALIRRNRAEGHQVLFHAEDVDVAMEDSTYIRMMKMVEQYASPADMAVIISGDVDAQAALMKLKYMSYMVAPSVRTPDPVMEWDGVSRLRCTSHVDSVKALTTIMFDWKAPRTPAEYMQTVQAAVYDKTVWEFADIAERWVRRALSDSDIPVADVRFLHHDSRSTLPYETFEFSVTVDTCHAHAAEATVSDILSVIDHEGVSAADLALAEGSYMTRLAARAGKGYRSNSEYVRICTDAFLYGTSLSTDSDRYRYLKSKDVSDSVSMKIFTGVVSALLDADEPGDLMKDYSSSLTPGDSVAFPDAGPKVKVRSSRKDPLSGGVTWIFDNGFKVVYKKMPTGRDLYYSLSLNGGYASIEDLARGEGAFISDCLESFWISGMKGERVKEMLRLSGMTMRTRVSLSNTVVTGKVEDRNADLLMRALLAFANESRPDTAAFSYYMSSENLRLRHLRGGARDARAAIDSLMCPEYRYSPFKSEGCLQPGTIVKAAAFHKAQTSKMNDGVLVLVGDMDESALKKILQTYVGKFRTKSVAFRSPAVQYQPLSGTLTVVAEGTRPALIIAASAAVPMTAENRFAMDLAADLLERAMKDAFAGEDVQVRLSHAGTIYPQERFSVMMEVRGGSMDHVRPAREVLDKLASAGPDDSLVKLYKDALKHEHALMMQEPEYWLRAVTMRNLDGKDFTIGCASKIDAVTSSRLKELFKLLNEGGRIEYVIK